MNHVINHELNLYDETNSFLSKISKSIGEEDVNHFELYKLSTDVFHGRIQQISLLRSMRESMKKILDPAKLRVERITG